EECGRPCDTSSDGYAINRRRRTLGSAPVNARAAIRPSRSQQSHLFRSLHSAFVARASEARGSGDDYMSADPDTKAEASVVTPTRSRQHLRGLPPLVLQTQRVLERTPVAVV